MLWCVGKQTPLQRRTFQDQYIISWCVVNKMCHFLAFVGSRISDFAAFAKNKWFILWRLPRTCKQCHFLPFGENVQTASFPGVRREHAKYVISWRSPRTCKTRHYLPFAENMQIRHFLPFDENMQTEWFSGVRPEQIMSHFLRYAASKICYLLAFAEYTGSVFWNTGYTDNNNKQKLIRLMNDRARITHCEDWHNTCVNMYQGVSLTFLPAPMASCTRCPCRRVYRSQCIVVPRSCV